MLLRVITEESRAVGVSGSQSDPECSLDGLPGFCEYKSEEESASTEEEKYAGRYREHDALTAARGNGTEREFVVKIECTASSCPLYTETHQYQQEDTTHRWTGRNGRHADIFR